MVQPTILRFDSIDSTNLEAMRQAKAGAPEGLCIVAREQTAGRGRLDRKWHSPRDAGLYLSLLLRPGIEMSSWPLLTLMTSSAVAEALMKSSGLNADIKWPNDVCVNDRKLCGILAESVETTGGPAAVMGVGINLKSDALTGELRDAATSVMEATGHEPDQELILRALLKAVSERYELLHGAGGGEHTIREWCAKSSYAFDRQVRVTMDGSSFTGVTRGLESDGALRVETYDRRIRIVRAGELTALRVTSNE
jgi:BirA family transcriptional regulator, biotin operon repressor / biotin---[acetyl-CoA-carboxylase] ligase